MEKTVFDSDKMYTYLRGYASGAGMGQTMKALSFAREKHAGQMRKSGEPYIVHLLTMACNYHIVSVMDSLDAAMQVYRPHEGGTP